MRVRRPAGWGEGPANKAWCRPSDTIGDLKKLAAAQLGTRPEKLVIKRQQYTILKDHITLADYEITDGSGLELYFQ